MNFLYNLISRAQCGQVKDVVIKVYDIGGKNSVHSSVSCWEKGGFISRSMFSVCDLTLPEMTYLRSYWWGRAP